MIWAFILPEMTKTMPRRTIYLPDETEKAVRERAILDESFSATIVRLLEFGIQAEEDQPPLDYIGAGSSGLPDLGINAEKYLGLKPWGPGEGPGDEGPG
jgi:hypothetical protein